ncbi:MAG: xanthine dehydrogenase family protein subunit M [Rhodobacteraceae bacterium]|nr:xanthine dehydrogenase family protein subunit M [Paracoccaceae bacterium]
MRFESPSTVAAAAALLAEPGARALAGGSDLLVQMKSGMVQPAVIVDLKRIAGLGEIRETPDAFIIGAAVPGAALREAKALRKAWPGLVDGSKLIGSTQIQGRATVAGNLCNASPAADSVPAMAACGAMAVVTGPNGSRTVPVEDIPVGPGRTSLAKGELVEAIRLPKPPPRTGSAYLRFTPRTEMDIAVASVGIALSLDADGTVTAAKVVLGAVGPKVIIPEAAARALIGTRADAAALDALAAACSAAATPIDDKRGTKEFRIRVVGVLARRAAEKAIERAKGK